MTRDELANDAEQAQSASFALRRDRLLLTAELLVEMFAARCICAHVPQHVRSRLRTGQGRVPLRSPHDYGAWLRSAPDSLARTPLWCPDLASGVGRARAGRRRRSALAAAGRNAFSPGHVGPLLTVRRCLQEATDPPFVTASFRRFTL